MRCMRYIRYMRYNLHDEGDALRVVACLLLEPAGHLLGRRLGAKPVDERLEQST